METALNEPKFGTLNWAVLIGYLVFIFLLGSYLSRRGQASSKEFFKSKGMHWLPVSLSMLASLFSGIAFLSHPARAFRNDSVLLMFSVAVILVTPIIAYVLLPFYRRLDVTTAYEYLEKRFHLNIRLLASALFLCKRLFWLSLVALAPSLALSVFTGMRVEYCVLIIGLTTTIYTALGGMTAVIWADAVQFVVFMLGQLLIIGVIASRMDGGLTEIYRMGWESGHAWMSMEWDLSKLTMWTMLISGVVIALSDMGSDQLIVQRMMVTKDIQAARKSLWLNSLIKIPTMSILMGIGVSLWAFYHVNPEKLTLLEKDYEKIVPFFVVSEIPQGLGGLIFAGVFAAAMSSFDSGLHSLVTVFSVDWYQKILKPGQNDQQFLKIAKLLTLCLGISVTLLAIVIYRTGIKSLVDASNIYQGFFGGGLLGLFLLGVFTRRAKALPCVIGVIVAVAVDIVIDQYQIRTKTVYLHSYLFGAVALAITVVIGYFGSFIGPALPYEKTQGLTIAAASDKNA